MAVICKKCGYVEMDVILVSENVVRASSENGCLPAGVRCPKCNGEWKRFEEN